MTSGAKLARRVRRADRRRMVASGLAIAALTLLAWVVLLGR